MERVEEGIFDFNDWWERLKNLFEHHAEIAAREASDLVEDRALLERRIAMCQTNLEKKIAVEESLASVGQAIGRYLLYIPKLFWQKLYLPYVTTRFGWLRDKFWAAYVKSRRPDISDYESFSFTEGVYIRNKEAYSGVFFMCFTVALIFIISQIALITPIYALLRVILVDYVLEGVPAIFQ